MSTQLTDNDKALALQEALKYVNELRIPVVTREKVTLKERANLARGLFKQLGLKHISVRKATGVWCLWVEIGLPRMNHDAAMTDNRHMQTCTGCIYQAKTRLALEEILQRAFPKEIDLSDDMTDYFRPAWTFHC